MRFRKSMLMVLIAASLAALYLGLANIVIKFDKFVHFSVFFLMTFIFYCCFETKDVRQLRLITFIVCTLIGGIGSEFLQSIMPYRTFDVNDIFMNILGSLLSLATSDLYARYMVRRRRLKRLQIIKSIGDEAENLAESVNASARNSSTYSDSFSNRPSTSSSNSNRTSLTSPYIEDDNNNYSDYFSEDLENQTGPSRLSRARRDTTSIELKNVAPIALNQLDDGLEDYQ